MLYLLHIFMANLRKSREWFLLDKNWQQKHKDLKAVTFKILPTLNIREYRKMIDFWNKKEKMQYTAIICWITSLVTRNEDSKFWSNWRSWET